MLSFDALPALILAADNSPSSSWFHTDQLWSEQMQKKGPEEAGILQFKIQCHPLAPNKKVLLDSSCYFYALTCSQVGSRDFGNILSPCFAQACQTEISEGGAELCWHSDTCAWRLFTSNLFQFFHVSRPFQTELSWNKKAMRIHRHHRYHKLNMISTIRSPALQQKHKAETSRTVGRRALCLILRTRSRTWPVSFH